MSKPISLAIIGATGGVGSAFLAALPSIVLPPSTPRPQLIFLSRSKKQLYNKDYSPVSPEDLASSSSPLLSLPDLAKYLSTSPNPTVLVDNTSDQSVAEAYPLFLKSNISIITPNKKAFSSPLPLWNAIFSAVTRTALVYHESSVGAGLPIISTLNDLVRTGDQVTRIEGVFSGTMSFLFNTFAPASESASSPGKWSEIVGKAKAAGYTEPDPRDDLNGMDVARKCVILARCAGLKVESTSSFPIQSLIPSALESASSADEFMQKLPNHDDEMESYKTEAKKQGKVVRYVGKVDVENNKVSVGLEMVDQGSPIAGLKGSDNLICFYTKRYGSNPLVVQGAGAGNEVTAMGVLADLVKVIERLG
ncbi:Homoserine dehydrogenase [Cyphellophora attinorum]|uniref:Homoserine dehydrogenase n=1 Tax=Cyphellophora attinorum TaxID=1664694 RepID=A0A0N1HQW0_9EURO|nr:Homoserine dehydrogenase [Phialophora attinorum]KPI40472.1 Homoserine dehydrogenase [Phialophora attinorum]